jgi:pilus assembly protein FimV
MGSMYEAKGVSSRSFNKDSPAYDEDAAAGESSFLSEITFADFDTFDTEQSEIDPVSEADVYLAYGRYQQAEELMRDTLKDQPDRDECKLKLLEIFYSRENKQAFETYASELAEAGKKDDVEFWTKVTEMGREICPDSILFCAGKNTVFEKNHANIAELDEVKTGSVMEIKKVDLGLVAFNELFHDEPVIEVSEAAGGILNFDLVSLEDDVLDDGLKNNESIDFDSGTLTDIIELDKTHEDVSWKSQEVTDKDEFESYNFDLSAKAVKEKEIDQIDLSVVNKVDEGYQSIDFSTDKPVGLSDSISINPLEGDFELDFDMPVAGLYGQDSELTDMDELETKLDLAMAYIDMNDSDAAKDIAKEVLEKGSPDQQMTAQALLDRLI